MSENIPQDRGALAPARLLYDIAQTFVHTVESAEDADARVRQGLVLLGQLVPYDRCALLDVKSGIAHRIVVSPESSTEEASSLAETLDELFALLSESHEPSTVATSKPWRAHLAVPLVGRDQVIGVLFVGRVGAPYQEEDLCLLSIVAAQIAAYLTTLRLHEEKDEFIATLSHELRTPLTAVLGWGSLLRSGSLGEPSRVRALESILRNATTLTRLTEDLLDLSRIATGKLRVELRPIELAPVVEASVEAARPQANARSIRLDCDVDRAGGLVLGDAERLQQVVVNLLGNAIKFTPPGGRIEVEVARAADHVQIKVSDNGKGISRDFLPHVFDRSRQAAASSRRGCDGLGLGLAIVRSLVELHRGQVRAESAGPGKGATFTVTLPLADAAAR